MYNVYRCAFFCAQGANDNACTCVSLHLFVFSSSARAVFYPLCFSKSIIGLSHFFFIPLFSLSSPLTHVGNVITFGGCGGGGGEGETLKQTWGRERKRHLYVYPITTPASPKSPSQRTDARTLKIATSIPPPLCAHVCWLQW